MHDDTNIATIDSKLSDRHINLDFNNVALVLFIPITDASLSKYGPNAVVLKMICSIEAILVMKC